MGREFGEGTCGQFVSDSHGKCWGSWNCKRLISKVAPSLTRLCLGSLWPRSPHMALQSPGTLPVAWAFSGMAQDSKSDCSVVARGSCKLHRPRLKVPHVIAAASCWSDTLLRTDTLLRAAQIQGEMNQITPSNLQSRKLWAIKELIVKLLWGINQFCNYWLPNNYFIYEEKKWNVTHGLFYFVFDFCLNAVKSVSLAFTHQ